MKVVVVAPNPIVSAATGAFTRIEATHAGRNDHDHFNVVGDVTK